MKRLVLAVLVLSNVGCARVWIDQRMQEDRSYVIEANGNGFASLENTKESAEYRAKLLCKSGYDTISEIPEDNIKPYYTLIVRCKDKS